MESTNPQTQSCRKVVILLILFVLVAVTAGAVVYAVLSSQEPETSEPKKIGYSEGIVVLDENMEFDTTPSDEMTLEYKGEALSEDGQTFDCYIFNAAENQYDMYLDLYADAELSDEIYLSELIKPGTGFQEIKLNRALEKGRHTAFLVFTQVEDDQSTIHGQLVVTIDLIVG